MYRFTVSNGRETYTWEEKERYWEGSHLDTGEWREPFPNEPGNSTAFGIKENFEQGRGRSGIVRNVNYVKIERISEEGNDLEHKVERG